MRRVFGFLVALCGVALIIFSIYVKNQVASGEEQIASAQKKVNQGSSLFSMSPYTKEVGKEITGSAQKKINAGKEQVGYYTQMASWAQMGGIALLVLGAVIIFFPRSKKK